MDSYVLLAIPLFMLSSSIMAESGMSNRLFDFFSYFFGNIAAGLPIAVVITCLFYGAICGSGPATVAAIGTMCIPLLTRLGYERDFVTAMIAVSGGLGVIIPPRHTFHHLWTCNRRFNRRFIYCRLCSGNFNCPVPDCLHYLLFFTPRQQLSSNCAEHKKHFGKKVLSIFLKKVFSRYWLQLLFWEEYMAGLSAPLKQPAFPSFTHCW